MVEAERRPRLEGWGTVYPASSELRWVTGQVPSIDGGLSLIGPARQRTAASFSVGNSTTVLTVRLTGW